MARTKRRGKRGRYRRGMSKRRTRGMRRERGGMFRPRFVRKTPKNPTFDNELQKVLKKHSKQKTNYTIKPIEELTGINKIRRQTLINRAKALGVATQRAARNGTTRKPVGAIGPLAYESSIKPSRPEILDMLG